MAEYVALSSLGEPFHTYEVKFNLFWFSVVLQYLFLK